MGKKGHAQATWKEGIDMITDYCDADIALSLIESLASLEDSVPPPAVVPPRAPRAVTSNTSTSTNTSTNTTATSTASGDKNPSSSALPSSSAPQLLPTGDLPLPPPPPSRLHPAKPNPSASISPAPSTFKQSSGAADAIAALGGKDRKVGMEQLKIIENHFIGFRPNQINPDVIKVNIIIIQHLEYVIFFFSYHNLEVMCILRCTPLPVYCAAGRESVSGQRLRREHCGQSHLHGLPACEQQQAHGGLRALHHSAAGEETDIS